jgi:hypothetical protein
MKTTQTRRARQKSWEGKECVINEITVEDKIMDQILEELTEILYLEFGQFNQDQNSLPMMGCSSKQKKDIA